MSENETFAQLLVDYRIMQVRMGCCIWLDEQLIARELRIKDADFNRLLSEWRAVKKQLRAATNERRARGIASPESPFWYR